MNVSLSKVDSLASNSFLKCLYAIALSFEVEFGPTLKGKLKMWATESTAFTKRFGINKKTWDTIINDVAGGSDPNENTRMFNRILNLAKDLREAKGDLKLEMDLTKQQIAQINDFTLWVLKENENAYNRMFKNVSTLGDADLTKVFVEDEEDLDVKGMDSVKKDIEKLVKKMTKRSDMDMTPEERKKHQGTEVYKQFLKSKRELNTIYKNRLQQMVRSSGKDLLDVDEVRRKLNSENIIHSIPEDFVGKINENGWLYTISGKRLKSNPGGKVRMNPSYDPMQDNAYVLEGIPYDGANPQRIYTEEFTAKQSGSKFTKVSSLIKVLPRMQKKWRRDMNVRGSKSVKALIVELVYLTQGRVSSTSAQTANERTFGITTLQARHIIIKGNIIHIKYAGKKGVKQHHIIRTNSIHEKQVKRLLEQLLDGKSGEDYIMTDSNGKRITGSMVNNYLKTIGAPAGVTIHKFRHARGTTHAQKILDKAPFDPKDRDYTEAEVTKWFIESIKEIGAELGHVSGEKVTANTAIANYIDPSVMQAFFERLKVRPPAVVVKAIARSK